MRDYVGVVRELAFASLPSRTLPLSSPALSLPPSFPPPSLTLPPSHMPTFVRRRLVVVRTATTRR